MNKYILIDSRYRTFGTPNNFKIYLPKPITIQSYIKLNYLYLPRQNYMINDTNDLIEIQFNNNTKISVRFNHQIYSPLLLCNYINTYVANYNNFSCNYNQYTFKIEFSANSPFSIDFSKSNFYKLVSLDKIVYNCDSFNKLITNCINFNHPYYININIANISNDVMLGSNDKQQVNFIIPMLSCNFGDILQYDKNTYDFKIYVDNKTLNYLDFIITNDDGLLFDNNNAEWFCILEFH